MVKKLSILSVLFLAGCGTALAPTGTLFAEFSGSVCGQPFEASVKDGKERAGFRVSATCPDGGNLTVEANDVRAFEGQQIGAAANEAMVRLMIEMMDRVFPRTPPLPGPIPTTPAQ